MMAKMEELANGAIMLLVASGIFFLSISVFLGGGLMLWRVLYAIFN
jgi:hypothetical protein